MNGFATAPGVILLLLGSGAVDAAADGAIFFQRGDAGTSVVGGRIVDPVERYPYMAGFYPDRGCGAVLVHPRVLLTAAHCGRRAASFPATVDVGRWNVAEDVDGDAFDTHAIQDYLRHPDWTGKLGTPDFALMLLATPSAMVPVALARKKAEASAGRTAVVVGWGRVDDDDESLISARLKEADTRITTDATCDGYMSKYKDINSETNLCTDGVNGQSCNGDSGGPLIIKDAGGNATLDLLVGLVSWGPRQCRGEFGAYSRTSWAYEWIEATLRKRWGLVLDPNATPTPSGAPSVAPSTSSSASPSAASTGYPSDPPSTSEGTGKVDRSKSTKAKSTKAKSTKAKSTKAKSTSAKSTKAKSTKARVGKAKGVPPPTASFPVVPSS